MSPVPAPDEVELGRLQHSALDTGAPHLQETQPHRTLPHAYAQGPREVLERWAFSDGRQLWELRHSALDTPVQG